jgi:hypothetical protein
MNCSCSRGGSAMFCECRERVAEIARANANMAVDQRDAYDDSISSFAQNVRDTLEEEGLHCHRWLALKAYYARVVELL